MPTLKSRGTRKGDGLPVWTAVCYAGRDTKQRRFSFAGPKREAERALRRFVADLQDAPKPVELPTRTVTVRDQLRRWQDVRESTWAARSVVTYESVSRNHVEPYLGKLTLAEVTPAKIADWLAVLSRKRGKRVVQLAFISLSAALELAVQEDLIPANPAKRVVKPSLGYRERAVLSASQTATLLRALEHLEDKHFTGKTLSRIVTVLALTGLRRGELAGLRFGDLNWQTGTLRINRTVQAVRGKRLVLPPKTRRSARTVPVPPFVLALLAEQRRDELARLPELALSTDPELSNWYCFPDESKRDSSVPIDPSVLSKSFRAAFTEIAANEGLPTIRMHDLRGGYVSLLHAQGVPLLAISNAVGHASVGFTLGTYGSILGDPMAEAATAISNAFTSMMTPPVDGETESVGQATR